ncbi:hypothetical protein ACLI4U_16770 [Natrialbaceae archaeon A-CW2]
MAVRDENPKVHIVSIDGFWSSAPSNERIGIRSALTAGLSH